MRDAASDSAAAQVDMTAPCVPVGSLDYLYANGSRGEQVSYAADFRDASIDPATVRAASPPSHAATSSTRRPSAMHPSAPRRAARADSPDPGTALSRPVTSSWNCGTATLTHNNPTPPYEQSADVTRRPSGSCLSSYVAFTFVEPVFAGACGPVPHPPATLSAVWMNAPPSFGTGAADANDIERSADRV